MDVMVLITVKGSRYLFTRSSSLFFNNYNRAMEYETFNIKSENTDKIICCMQKY